jgi:hypothetical protein
MDQPELPFAKQARRQHGVEHGLGNEIEGFAQQPKVVVGAVHDQFVLLQDTERGRQLDSRERIEKLDRIFKRDLYEAKLLRVGVKTVGLGIERYPGSGIQLCQKRRQPFFRVNHAPIYPVNEFRRRIMGILALAASCGMPNAKKNGRSRGCFLRGEVTTSPSEPDVMAPPMPDNRRILTPTP